MINCDKMTEECLHDSQQQWQPDFGFCPLSVRAFSSGEKKNILFHRYESVHMSSNSLCDL